MDTSEPNSPHGRRRPSNRELKREMAVVLRGNDAAAAMEALVAVPARRAVNPLFAMFCDRDRLLRWRAVTAMGAVVAGLAERQPESARVVMRRFMWNLNEESGGIGWGCPEAMAEAMARSRLLAREYACILVSYANPQGNFIEHPALQEGVLWGIGRLAGADPSAAADAAAWVGPFLSAEAPALRGLAARAAGLLAAPGLAPLLEPLRGDAARLEVYEGWDLARRSVDELAADALARLAGLRNPG
jgi:hypothetical protein